MSRLNRSFGQLMTLIAGLGGVTAVASAQTCPACSLSGCPAGRQVNISGATLFVDFFKAPASSNDSIDVDGDGCFGFGMPGCFPNLVDNLAGPLNGNPWWTLQYRSVGSLNGLSEFVVFQLCCQLPEAVPSEAGIINNQLFAELGSPLGPPFGLPACTTDTDGDGLLNASNTPVCPCSIDIASVDVPALWATTGANGAAIWNLKPGQAGYGKNPQLSWALSPLAPNPGPAGQTLVSLSRDCDNDGQIDASLNTNVGSPDGFTIYDYSFVYSPIAVIANRGANVENIDMSDLQYLFTTGRLSSGRNLQAATRDAGSGTRNGAMNSIGIDPSWGRGENLGALTVTAAEHDLGPHFRASNCGGSGNLENAIQNSRLAIGYTGLAGAGRAVADATAGLYEIVNVRKDIAGATQFVRPSVQAVVANANVNTGWQIGGNQTFTTRGDFQQTNPGAPDFMCNQHAADYLRNLDASIQAFEENPDASTRELMPGQLLANTFFLLAGVQALPSLVDPVQYTLNPGLNIELHDFILEENDFGVGAQSPPPFGSVTPAGRVPDRIPNPDFDGDGVFDTYADDSANGDYRYFTPTGGPFVISDSGLLAQRNRVQGDFNHDGLLNLDDAAAMMRAVMNPAQFFDLGPGNQPIVVPGNPGSQVANVPIAHILGDFDGNGNFDRQDVRYFADGLGLPAGPAAVLNRGAAFAAVDNAWLALTGDDNYFDTLAATGKPYQAGDSRADVAGAEPHPGASPSGHDGFIDEADIDYVFANFGDWTDLNQAVHIDLSCDMNGDLRVDMADVTWIVETALGTCIGDADLDGAVGLGDLGAVLTAYNGPSDGWSSGDFDGDGDVDLADLGAVLASYGVGCN